MSSIFYLMRLSVMMIALSFAAAHADEKVVPGGVLLELFTSQGCYSCPPADKLLHSVYGQQAGLIPLEFHVDYWDELVYGFSGSWKDPFSSPYYTERQRAYNVSIRGTRSMYTPQLVVQGHSHAVGSNRADVDQLLTEAKISPLTFHFSGNAADGWRARVAGTLIGHEDLYYAIYIKEQTTTVTAGENKGKEMLNSYIVRAYSKAGSGRHISVPPYDPQREGCAVWVQKPQTGTVLAAAQCPAS